MSTQHLHPEILGAMVDGELAPHEAALAQAHLNQCLPCSSSALALLQLQAATRRAAACHQPAPDVLARLRAATQPAPTQSARPEPALPQPSRPQPGRPGPGRTSPARPRMLLWQIAAALALLAIALIAWKSQRQSDTLTAELLDQHLATLAPGSQPQVLSSDRHTVKPWFEGRLPFSFNLPEPTALPAGTALAGADLAYIHGSPAALLRFTIHKHRATVFVTQPSAIPALPGPKTRSGFQFVHSTAAGLDYLAISDVNSAELQALVQSLTAAQ